MRKQFKKCKVCNKNIKKGEGGYFQNNLIHKKCLSMAKVNWFKYKKIRW